MNPLREPPVVVRGGKPSIEVEAVAKAGGDHIGPENIEESRAPEVDQVALTIVLTGIVSR